MCGDGLVVGILTNIGTPIPALFIVFLIYGLTMQAFDVILARSENSRED